MRRDRHVLEIEVGAKPLGTVAHAELESIVDAYLADADLWVAVLLAPEGLSGEAHAHRPIGGLAGLTRRDDLHKPVIAAVGGEVSGAGLEIVLACHLVVADESSTFALPGVRYSDLAEAGSLARLTAAVPPPVTRDLVLTGRAMSMPEALRWGLVSRSASSGRLDEVALGLAAEVVEGSPTAQRLSLRLLAGDDPAQVADEAMVSTDGQLGAAAYFTGVEPQWRNS